MFFLVKAKDEVEAGNISGALKTVFGGVEPNITTLEDDAAVAWQAFLAAFGASEGKTLLTSLTTGVTNGIKAGLAVAETGTVTNAEAAAGDAVKAVESVVETPAGS